MNTFAVAAILFATLAFSAAQTTGNHELLLAINTAMSKWISGGAASTSWKAWYGYDYPATGSCSGYTYPTPSSGGTLQAVINRGELKVGAAVPLPPLVFTDSNGKLVGFDQDFANFLASELTTQYKKTITITRVTTAFNDLLTQLNNQAYDVASGGIAITADREALVAFSCNISTGGLGGAVLPANKNTYASISDLLKAGVTVGALQGTIQATKAAAAGATVVYISTLDDGFTALSNGSISAWLGSQTTIAYWAIANPGNAIYQIPTWGDINGVGWAVRDDTGHATTSAGSVAQFGVPMIISAVLFALWL